jgi:hypothetical protein
MQIEFGPAVESDTIARFMSLVCGWTVTLHTSHELEYEGTVVDWNKSDIRLRFGNYTFQNFPWEHIDKVVIH